MGYEEQLMRKLTPRQAAIIERCIEAKGQPVPLAGGDVSPALALERDDILAIAGGGWSRGYVPATPWWCWLHRGAHERLGLWGYQRVALCVCGQPVQESCPVCQARREKQVEHESVLEVARMGRTRRAELRHARECREKGICPKCGCRMPGYAKGCLNPECDYKQPVGGSTR